MRTFLFTFFMLICFNIKGQDKMILRTGEEQIVKVVEIGIDEIKYKKTETGPVYVIKKNDVFMISYSDGTKDVFKETKDINLPDVPKLEIAKPEIKKEEIDPTIDYAEEGAGDAHIYYGGRNSGAGGTFFTSIFLSSVLGLVPAIACSSTPPNTINLNIPKNKYSKNEDYIQAYRHESFHIKKNKVWTFWGIGLGLNIFAYMYYSQFQ